MDTLEVSSTRPYLIRALFEWCNDNGLTPYVAVSVNESVQVPREFVKDGEIVLNIGYDATSALKLGNNFIEFKARFAGIARDILVPVDQVSAIYARENGQGMAFPQVSNTKSVPSSTRSFVPEARDEASAQAGTKLVQLASVESDQPGHDSADPLNPPRSPATSSRPTLKRVK